MGETMKELFILVRRLHYDFQHSIVHRVMMIQIEIIERQAHQVEPVREKEKKYKYAKC